MYKSQIETVTRPTRPIPTETSMPMLKCYMLYRQYKLVINFNYCVCQSCNVYRSIMFIQQIMIVSLVALCSFSPYRHWVNHQTHWSNRTSNQTSYQCIHRWNYWECYWCPGSAACSSFIVNSNCDWCGVNKKKVFWWKSRFWWWSAK